MIDIDKEINQILGSEIIDIDDTKEIESIKKDLLLHSLCAITRFVYKSLGATPQLPYVRILHDLPEVTIWLVDGKYVRDHIDLDFTEGGNGGRFEFIPDDEVWIDDTLDEAEWKDTISHELLERFMMSQGDSYDTGHEKANILEGAERAID